MPYSADRNGKTSILKSVFSIAHQIQVFFVVAVSSLLLKIPVLIKKSLPTAADVPELEIAAGIC
jgi:hypothetical protein